MKKIIAAATITSYFFSVSGAFKGFGTFYNNRLIDCKKVYDLTLEHNKQCENLITKLKNIGDFDESIDTIKTSITVVSEELEILTQCNKDKIKKAEKYVFLCNALGYLSFFCIAMFQPIYDKIANLQEILTLLAFIIMLVSDYILDFIPDKFSERINNLYKNIEENMAFAGEIYKSIM